ncbi:MAG TPA: YoaK family protein [Vicinamibacteria bacterium]|jgi:uncharacterized membrane protein YoaK (UPF0700 family)|nr:YoaK family protein [Vicinamibacteria bacterium]
MTSTSSSPPPVLTFVLLGLTAVTGVIDATSYLGLGHVFTANMTGNVALLGFAIASAQGLSIARSGTALGAFLVGAVFGGRMATGMSAGPRFRWTGVAFGTEAALLFAGMAVAIGHGNSVSGEPVRLYVLIVLTGLAMGIRNATVRKLGVPDLTTTVLTLTLAALAADSTLAGGSNAGSWRRIASVAATIGGAAMGTWLLRGSLTLPLATCGAISGVCALAAYFGLAGRGETAPPTGAREADQGG